MNNEGVAMTTHGKPRACRVDHSRTPSQDNEIPDEADSGMDSHTSYDQATHNGSGRRSSTLGANPGMPFDHQLAPRKHCEASPLKSDHFASLDGSSDSSQHRQERSTAENKEHKASDATVTVLNAISQRKGLTGTRGSSEGFRSAKEQRSSDSIQRPSFRLPYRSGIGSCNSSEPSSKLTSSIFGYRNIKQPSSGSSKESLNDETDPVVAAADIDAQFQTHMNQSDVGWRQREGMPKLPESKGRSQTLKEKVDDSHFDGPMDDEPASQERKATDNTQAQSLMDAIPDPNNAQKEAQISMAPQDTLNSRLSARSTGDGRSTAGSVRDTMTPADFRIPSPFLKNGKGRLYDESRDSRESTRLAYLGRGREVPSTMLSIASIEHEKPPATIASHSLQKHNQSRGHDNSLDESAKSRSSTRPSLEVFRDTSGEQRGFSPTSAADTLLAIDDAPRSRKPDVEQNERSTTLAMGSTDPKQSQSASNDTSHTGNLPSLLERRIEASGARSTSKEPSVSAIALDRPQVFFANLPQREATEAPQYEVTDEVENEQRDIPPPENKTLRIGGMDPEAALPPFVIWVGKVPSTSTPKHWGPSFWAQVMDVRYERHRTHDIGPPEPPPAEVIVEQAQSESGLKKIFKDSLIPKPPFLLELPLEARSYVYNYLVATYPMDLNIWINKILDVPGQDEADQEYNIKTGVLGNLVGDFELLRAVTVTFGGERTWVLHTGNLECGECVRLLGSHNVKSFPKKLMIRSTAAIMKLSYRLGSHYHIHCTHESSAKRFFAQIKKEDSRRITHIRLEADQQDEEGTIDADSFASAVDTVVRNLTSLQRAWVRLQHMPRNPKQGSTTANETNGHGDDAYSDGSHRHGAFSDVDEKGRYKDPLHREQSKRIVNSLITLERALPWREALDVHGLEYYPYLSELWTRGKRKWWKRIEKDKGPRGYTAYKNGIYAP